MLKHTLNKSSPDYGLTIAGCPKVDELECNGDLWEAPSETEPCDEDLPRTLESRRQATRDMIGRMCDAARRVREARGSWRPKLTKKKTGLETSIRDK
eukprot:7342241-Pyramimonas_sp.AAC.1